LPRGTNLQHDLDGFDQFRSFGIGNDVGENMTGVGLHSQKEMTMSFFLAGYNA